jgi:hypothetical protein
VECAWLIRRELGLSSPGTPKPPRSFIPQIDAAILVVGADPPISGEELALIEAVAVNVDEILIVLNKLTASRLRNGNKRQSLPAKFLRDVLRGLSAKFMKSARSTGLTTPADADDWNSLVENLQLLAGKSGQAMTRSAAERGVRRFSASLQRSIDERLRALSEPIANSEQRIANLRQTVSQAEQSLRDLGALFSAEQMRLSMTLLRRRKEFLKQVLPIAQEEFKHETGAVATTFGPARRRELMAIAQAVARRHVMPWLDTEETQAEELYRAVTQRFINLVNGLLLRISEEQAADFSHLPKSLDAEHGFRTRSRFFFHDMITIAQPASLMLYVVDCLTGAFTSVAGCKRTRRTFWNSSWTPTPRAFKAMWNSEWWRAACVLNPTFAGCCAR